MVILLILITIITAAFIHQKIRQRKLPKGPSPLPIIGNIHQLVYYSIKNGGVVEAFREFEKQYGKVFTTWIGPLPTVNIADFALAQETHVKNGNAYADRFSQGITAYLREGRGIIGSSGVFWQEHRRFALHTLRNFGLGRNIMEERILEELDTDASIFFDLVVGSIINKILVSQRFEKDDQNFAKLKRNLEISLETATPFEMFAPTWLLKTWMFKWRHAKTFKPIDDIHDFVKDCIGKRLKEIENGTYEVTEEANDFLGAFLYKIECDKNNNVEKSNFTLETLAIDMLDLWLAGQETTSTTLTWGFLCLLKNPEVVEKIRAELNKTTSNGSRNLSLSDKPNTPYLVATINEIQRITSILNINLLRVVNEDTFIEDQPIAAGTAVSVQLSLLHTDERLFKNHKEFNPDRFIENEGLEKKLIPFGIGKRVCLGEALARAELYLIIGNLILRYNLEKIGQPPPLVTINPVGILKRPPSYRMRLIPIR
ncbi:unnamed protein product [Caenorhabditis bovis]|uniref:CYtochrome P450 family n=1 Tax=Caenorhabditis bovis TaxID=2654633 RepID=A0A8S1EFB6_9PELO|nr:unnamed protein product [Caenorhabditis bovis]